MLITSVQDAHKRGISERARLAQIPRVGATARAECPVQRVAGRVSEVTIMVDGEIRLSTGSTIAAVAWGIALGFLVLTWTTASMRMGVTTVVLGQVAAVATVRQLLVGFSRTFRNGFEVGRGSVAPMSRR